MLTRRKVSLIFDSGKWQIIAIESFQHWVRKYGPQSAMLSADFSLRLTDLPTMDFIWILVAFLFGLLARSFSLPPLVGYLAAGFALNYAGVTLQPSLTTLADLGITLMLFTVGLKLNIKELMSREVWLGTGASMTLWVVIAGSAGLLASMAGLYYFAGLQWQTLALIAFAGSFSSTVCIIKILEEGGELRTRHGNLAIGILVMQDIIAVAFLVAATGKLPLIWAPLLLLLIPLRPLLSKVLSSAGHGELLPLAGLFMALGAYELFELVNIKGDLGALMAGALLAKSDKASELNKSLMSFKDLFLIGFFLSIGLSALPDLRMIAIALLMVLLIPLKFAIFFTLFVVLKLRVRTAFIGAIALSNYSEFGLIVADIAVKSQWLNNDWLVILAMSVSLSFVFTSILYQRIHKLYRQLKPWLKRWEHTDRLPKDNWNVPKDPDILVIGTGRVGKSAYAALRTVTGERVIAIDADRARVEKQKEEGFNVFFGDGEDADLWDNVPPTQFKLVLLALPSTQDTINITNQLRQANYGGQIAAIARYQDQVEALKTAGADKVFNFFAEAGMGFAEESLAMIDIKQGTLQQST